MKIDRMTTIRRGQENALMRHSRQFTHHLKLLPGITCMLDNADYECIAEEIKVGFRMERVNCLTYAHR